MLNHLSDSSRIWIFGADRGLTGDEIRDIRDTMHRFLGSWAAHNVPLAASAEVLHDRFIVVALDESMNASGCSIDTLFQQISAIEKRFGLKLLDSSFVYYRGERGVEATDRAGFRKLASEGMVSEETAVFDPALGTLGELRAQFPKAAGESWHRTLLGR